MYGYVATLITLQGYACQYFHIFILCSFKNLISLTLCALFCRNLTLLEAWNMLRKVHRRAQPNDGFARILLDLDKRLHGKISMEWQHRRPTMKVCPICGKNAGLSSSSLKLHLQKSHKKISSGSVDSAMTLEIQKAIEALKISRSGSVSPTQKQLQSQSQSFIENLAS